MNPSTTCGSLNIYEHCGDGICGDDEDTSNCSADCGSSEGVDSSGLDEGTLEAVIGDVDAAGGFNGTAIAAYGATGVYASYSIVDSGDEGEGLDDSYSPSESEAYTCTQKKTELDVCDKMIRSLSRQLWDLSRVL